MISITRLIVSGLAAWRFARFIIDDELFAPVREGLLNRYERFAHSKDRKYHQKLWMKLEVLATCIYCVTFWAALVAYGPFMWLINIGAIWAVATLVGLSHNVLFETDEDSEQDKVE